MIRFGRIAGTVACALLLHSQLRAQLAPPAAGDAHAARRGAGIRVGVWQVPDPDSAAVRFQTSPHFEGFFQRGLGRRLALESTAAVWRRTATQTVAVTGNEVVTQSYVFPLMTALKLYPFTGPGTRIEPYLLGGLGFALGVADEGENAIGGGGTSIQTGFGLKTGAGIELRVTETLGIVGAARYQLVKYGEELGFGEKFAGVGYEGGLFYRFNF